MAGTCYIITEGGKTHTFQQQQYLQQKKKTENIPTISVKTSGWRKPVQSHLTAPCSL